MWGLPQSSLPAQAIPGIWLLLPFAMGDPEGVPRPLAEQHLPRCGIGAARTAACTTLLPRHTDHGCTPASQRSFRNFPSREPMRRMHTQEVKAELSLDRLQLESLHKVRGLS